MNGDLFFSFTHPNGSFRLLSLVLNRQTCSGLDEKWGQSTPYVARGQQGLRPPPAMQGGQPPVSRRLRGRRAAH